MHADTVNISEPNFCLMRSVPAQVFQPSEGESSTCGSELRGWRTTTLHNRAFIAPPLLTVVLLLGKVPTARRNLLRLMIS